LEGSLLLLRQFPPGVLQNLLFKREHVRQKVTAGNALMLESLALKFASLLLNTFVMLLDLALDFVLDLEGLALGGLAFGLVRELHHT
jgi:hypothetical protein